MIDDSSSHLDIEKNYDRAITLIQYYVQLSWLVLGAFLLSATFLLGSLVSLIQNGPSILIFIGAIFGLFLCIPWWTSFKYNHSFYLLRIEEAKNMEPTPSGSNFFTNGKILFDNRKLNEVILPRNAKFLGPKRAVSFLIILFAIAFGGIAVLKNPFYSIDNILVGSNKNESSILNNTLTQLNIDTLKQHSYKIIKTK
jgi:hypothetical protein